MHVLLLADLVVAAAALLRSGTSKGAPNAACNCLPWRDAYRRAGSSCGQANELWTQRSPKPPMKKEFCTDFYERITWTSCTNINFHNRATKQWCYVSSRCKSLNGGKSIPNTEISWKTCTKGEDDLLVEKTPEQLHVLAMRNDLNVGLVVKMAYPREWWRWNKVAYLFAPLGREKGERADLDRKNLLAAVESGRPMVLDSFNGHPPFVFVVNRTAYEVKPSMWTLKKLMKQEDIWEHPSKVTTMKPAPQKLGTLMASQLRDRRKKFLATSAYMLWTRSKNKTAIT